MEVRIEPNGKATFLGVDYKTEVWYPNFSGTVSEYNGPKGTNPHGQPVGKRSFQIEISNPNDAEALKAVGYNLKEKASTNPDEPPKWRLDVTLKYANPRYAPVVFTIEQDGTNETYKTEATVDDLDHYDIRLLDFTVRPYEWNYLGRSGISAELERLRATLEKLPF